LGATASLLPPPSPTPTTINVILSRRLASRHKHIVVSLEHATDALEDPREPVNVDDVEDDARQYEEVPHDTELAAVDRPVHRVDFVPVRWNTRDTRQKESQRHCKSVEQKKLRPPRITHHIQEPPTDINIT